MMAITTRISISVKPRPLGETERLGILAVPSRIEKKITVAIERILPAEYSTEILRFLQPGGLAFRNARVHLESVSTSGRPGVSKATGALPQRDQPPFENGHGGEAHRPRTTRAHRLGDDLADTLRW